MFHPSSNHSNGKVEMLKIKLKSVIKLKIRKEMTVYKLRNTEHSFCEELYTLRNEIEHLSEQLEDLKDKISETTYEISRIEMSKTAERSKMETRISYLNAHKKEFDDMFSREHEISELRNKGLKEKEAEEQEIERRRQKQIKEKNQQQVKEVEAIENECDEIEKECTVLKKRNNAIMLTLRRRLVDTEDARRDLMKKQSLENDIITET